MRWKAVRSENRGHPERCKAPRGRSPTGLGRKGQLSVIKGSTADLAKTMPKEEMSKITLLSQKNIKPAHRGLIQEQK